MAIFHLAVKHASRSQGRSALAHATYIAREGPYARGRFAEQFVQVGHRNMPAWAQVEPTAFWAAADTHERANGRLYTELEIALPRELTLPDQLALTQAFLDTQIGTAHPCTWALHISRALDGAPQPHVHIMLSERTLDGVERGPAQFFRRAHPADPARGGAAKDPAWHQRDKVETLRVAWEATANQALTRAGLAVRIDHRCLEAQGLDRAPEPKLGPVQTALLRRGVATPESAQVLELRAHRAHLTRVDQAVEHVQAQLIDLTQVRAAREAQTPAPRLQEPLTPAEAARVARVLAEEPARRAAQTEARLTRLLAQVPDPAARLTTLLERGEAWFTTWTDYRRQQLERTTGLPHRLASAERVQGQLLDRVSLMGQDFGRVQTRTDQVVLVPWSRSLEPHRGQTVAIQVDAQQRLTRVLAVVPPRTPEWGHALGEERGLGRGG